MISLSFDELRLIAQLRNISDYENKYKEHLIKTLSEAKPETPKPEKKSKPETPRTRKMPKQTKPKPELEPKIRVKTDKRKLKRLRKGFDELRYKFSKNKIGKYRKAFHDAKNKKNIFPN